MRDLAPQHKENVRIGQKNGIRAQAMAPYESLMPPAEIRYGILAACGLSIVLRQLGPIQEVAVIKNSARARVSAIPIAAGMNFGRRPSGEVARIVSQVIFVAITAALFIAWLISSH
jgi:hypothetical protein